MKVKVAYLLNKRTLCMNFQLSNNGPVFSYVYLSYVFCTQYYQCLWIVHSWLSLRFSLMFICPVSCIFNVGSVSRLSILDSTFGFLLCLFVPRLLYPMLLVSLDCPFLIVPSVFSNVYLSCVFCIQCCLFV